MESSMYFQEPTDQEQHHPSANNTCAACGSAKRRSPSLSLSPNRSNPKRERPIPLHPNLPLPTTSLVNLPAFSPLRRYNSEPVPLFLNPPQPPETAPAGGSTALFKPSPVRAGSSAARGIRRTVSAPESDLIAATDPIGESPNSKRLKRMKERMREMSKWCDQVIAEGDEEENDLLTHAEVVNLEAQKDDGVEDSESEEEAVSVEKNGDNLIIHMKCPCSKAYQFLLSGNNCYYKLM